MFTVKPEAKKTPSEIKGVRSDDGSPSQDESTASTSSVVYPETHSTKPHGVSNPAWAVLEAQNPENLECYQCKKDHPLSDIGSWDDPDSETKCTKLDQKYCSRKYVHPKFRLVVFRMIMKRIRLQGDNPDLLRLLSYRSGVQMEGTQVKQVIATPSIIEGRLLMRVQTVYAVPPNRESQFYLTKRNHFKCPHSSRASWYNTKLAAKLLEKFVALDTLPDGRQVILYSLQCDHCPTAFQVGLQRFEGEGTLLFNTKWQYLGSGLSPLESAIPLIMDRPAFYGAYDLDQKVIKGSFQYEGQDLDPSSSLTAKEREDQFAKSNSEGVRRLRTRETWYWRCWGRTSTFPHELANKKRLV